VTGFEPATSWSQTRRSTKLSYTQPITSHITRVRCAHATFARVPVECATRGPHGTLGGACFRVTFCFSPARHRLKQFVESLMKKPTLPFHFAFIATCSLSSIALGQTNADNASEQAALTAAATADAAASPAPTAAVEPPSLIPPNILPGPNTTSPQEPPIAPALEQLNALFKQTTLGKTADEHRLRVQTSELELRIRNDEGLHALKAEALRVPTDLERRHRLRAYYQAYYGKLLALATTPDLRDYLKAQQAAHELLLLQPRTRHETDEAEAEKLTQLSTGTTAGALPAPSQAPVSDILPRN
jgi:hypothetical protein